jgi:hypothetical protein
LRNAKELIKALLDPKIFNTFQITLDVPSDYKYMVQEPDFIWLKKELVRGTLLLYQVPINAIKTKTIWFQISLK